MTMNPHEQCMLLLALDIFNSILTNSGCWICSAVGVMTHGAIIWLCSQNSQVDRALSHVDSRHGVTDSIRSSPHFCDSSASSFHLHFLLFINRENPEAEEIFRQKKRAEYAARNAGLDARFHAARDRGFQIRQRTAYRHYRVRNGHPRYNRWGFLSWHVRTCL